MTPVEYGDVKRLYKFAIAFDSFTEVSKTCEHMIATGLESGEPGYYAMAVGIVTLYGRPFTKNARIGKLSTGMIPTEFRTLHSTLVEFRNKAFAHTDADGRTPGHDKMTELRLHFDGSHVNSFSSRPIFEPVLLPSIKNLSHLHGNPTRLRPARRRAAYGAGASERSDRTHRRRAHPSGGQRVFAREARTLKSRFGLRPKANSHDRFFWPNG